mgnify:CR=1 FL=1
MVGIMSAYAGLVELILKGVEQAIATNDLTSTLIVCISMRWNSEIFITLNIY